MKRLESKQPKDNFLLAVDFPGAAGIVTITWVQVTTTREQSLPDLLTGVRPLVDDAAQIVLSALASADTALLRIANGTSRQIYHIEVLASDNNGGVWDEDLILPVEEI